MNTIVQLFPLEYSDREQFILDNQEAFNYGAMEEFGLRDDHFEEEGQIISRDTIKQSIDGGEAYRIVLDGQKVGGISDCRKSMFVYKMKHCTVQFISPRTPLVSA